MNAEWAFDELRRRNDEDARFPPDIAPGMPGWADYCEVRYNRARRRKRAGLSRGQANEWVEWARKLESAR